MPTLNEILTAVTDFVNNFAVFIAAGLIVGVAAAAIGRLVRAGR